MSSSISCPDCNSQDVQKIDKNLTVTTEKNGCGRAIGGCLFLPSLLFIGKKTKTETQTYTYYVCRSCGKEFRKD